MTTELHLELLLGRWVLDPAGDRVGRIEEVRAEQQDQDWVIVEYWVGIAATIERLSAWNLGAGLLRLLGARRLNLGYRIPWNKLDLADPDHPRLLCPVDELQKITS